MTFSHYPTPRPGGLLPLHLGRLGAALGVLNARTREAVARSLAEAAAGLVGDVLRAALTPEGGHRGGGYWPEHTQSFHDPWRDEVDDRYGIPREYPEERWADDPYDEAGPGAEGPPPSLGWPAGLALALRVASLSLGRPPGRRPLLKALAVGTAGVAVAAV